MDSEKTDTSEIDNINTSLGSDDKAAYDFFSPFNFVFPQRPELSLPLEVSDFSHKLSPLSWPKPWTTTKMRLQKTASQVSQLRTVFLVNTMHRNPLSQACTKH